MAVTFELRHTEGLSRLGRLTTPHGDISTPALMPVVNPNRPLIDVARLAPEFGVQLVITNAYILRRHDELRERVLADGVHATIGFDGPVMTDSGTFQSYVYGDVDVAPDEIVRFQHDIGVDIATILDVFSTPERTEAEAAADVAETRDRAEASIEHAHGTALAFPVQGSVFPSLRESAAAGLRQLSPPGGAIHPIGGVVPLMEQRRYGTLAEVILGAKRGLDAGRAVHLFGAGHPHMLALAVYLGCDLFDSAAYAKFAADGRMMFPWGTEDLSRLETLPCRCPACAEFGSVDELRRTPDDARTTALAAHNLHATFTELDRVRDAQGRGRLFDLVTERMAAHPALVAALATIEAHVDEIEAQEPISYHRGLQIVPGFEQARAQVVRARRRVAERTVPRGPLVLSASGPTHELLGHDVHPFRPSRLGPVPFGLEATFPFSQSVEPALGHRDLLLQRTRLSELAKRWGTETMEPSEAMQRKGSTDVDGLGEQVAAIAAYQFGPRAARGLLSGTLVVETSPRTGRIRRVLVDGEHIGSLRAHDGFLSLKLAGARRLHAAVPSPALRLAVTADSAPFNAEGRSVFARFVAACDDALRPGDECLVVDEQDELVAAGRLLVSAREARELTAGMVAKVRQGVVSGGGQGEDD